MGFIREILSDLPTQRFQENVARSVDKKKEFTGCIGSAPVDLGNNTFSIKHELGREASGFIILTQATASSIKASLVKSDGTSVNISFAKAPGAFTVFLY
jgi:hypothetical protein